jgi:stage II sporulation protein AA (anti-sigma F factor antagonist)
VGAGTVGVKITEDNGASVALLEGDIDHHTAAAMREQIDEYIERKKPQLLCLDFSKIQFMDSSGIGLIMGRYRFVKLYGGDLKIIGASENMKRIIKLSGLGALGLSAE